MRNFLNSVGGGFGRTLGRFLFYAILGLLAYLILGNWKVDAYPYLGTSINGTNVSYQRVYETRNSLITGYDYWLTDLGQYQGIGNANGQYLTVSANYTVDIYFGSGSLPSPWQITSYLNNARNTLTASNLRCGIGDYMQGYDATYAPSVPQFSVNVLEQTQLRLKLQILFVYSQQRVQGAYTNVNASCWFARNPNNGLFAQIENRGNSPYVYYSGTTDYFTVSLVKDRSEELLEQMISQNNQINSNINNINNSLTNDTPPTNSDANDFLDELRDIIPTSGAISNLLLIPIDIATTILNAFNSNCSSPLILPWFNINGPTQLQFQCVSLNTLIKDNNTVTIIDLGLFIGLMAMFIPTIIGMWDTLVHLRDEFSYQYAHGDGGTSRVHQSRGRGLY